MLPKKSTNVRIQKTATLVPLLLRGLNAVSTELAASLAEYLFFKAPRRRPAGDRERAVLAGGERFDVPFNGEILRAWRWGEGPRVLLAHGWGGSAAQLAGFVEPLLDRGFSVVAFDAPAHGLSTGTASSIRDFAAAITVVAGGPIRGIIAHSMGGGTTLFASALGLQIERAVFIAPPADPAVWFEKFSAHLALPAALKRRTLERIEEYVGARFDEVNVHALGPHFDVPLLVIHDRADKEVPWRDGEEVADNVPAGAMISTEGLGHNRILKDPAVIERSVSFIAGEIQRVEHHCRACGARTSATSELCSQCTLSQELFDRRQRWAQLSA